ncbi:unnamed protein product [Arabidopsis halleri]
MTDWCRLTSMEAIQGKCSQSSILVAATNWSTQMHLKIANVWQYWKAIGMCRVLLSTKNNRIESGSSATQIICNFILKLRDGSSASTGLWLGN